MIVDCNYLFGVHTKRTKYYFSDTPLDQMSAEIESNAHRVMRQASEIEKSILTMNPSLQFSNLSKNNQHDDKAKCAEEDSANYTPSNTFCPNSKNALI